jgi:hypothetical protein
MLPEGPKRRFPPPWRIEQTDPESFRVVDANGITVASVPCRDDLQKWSFGSGHLTSDEARRIARGIARLPELLMQRRGFYPRGSGNYRMSADRPFHVALGDAYVRENWFDIDAICKLNGIPFRPTGERIDDGGSWRVFDFTWQIDAMLFWNHFHGRWLRGSEFHYPEKPNDLPPLKLPTEQRFNKPRPQR